MIKFSGMMLGLTVAVVAGFSLPAAAGPSFSCASASNDVEKTICASQELSDLDAQLVDIYNAVRKKVPAADQAALKESQVIWIGQRNGCGDNVGCLEDAYRGRIEALTPYL
jgi:uncharacterized protein